MDLYTLSLFTGGLIQALGVVLEVKWINDGEVHGGSFCRAQVGVLQNLGQASVAMTTILITLDTFATLWWHRVEDMLLLPSILVTVLWLFLILFTVISSSLHTHPPFYTPTLVRPFP